MRSSSSGELYPFYGDILHSDAALTVSTTRDLWHRRLGHPSSSSLSRISQDLAISCNKPSDGSSVCEVCQLGKQPRLPFSSSSSFTTVPFQLIHCDLWTSPVTSFSGYKYYLIVVDDYSHYSWSFPLVNKSDTASTFQRFFAYVKTQFDKIIQCVQCDNGGEFLNTHLRSFFSVNGVSFRLSCPHTSPQNGKAERMLRTTNDVIRTLLVQANLPPDFWVEALHTATHLLNIRPSRSIHHATPHFRLFGQVPTYNHLRSFGCLCYPNVYATTAHKLQPLSVRCVFIGYPQEHKGYRCLDLSSRRVFVSRYVIFDESCYPYFSPQPATPETTQTPASSDPTQHTAQIRLQPTPASVSASGSAAIGSPFPSALETASQSLPSEESPSSTASTPHLSPPSATPDAPRHHALPPNAAPVEPPQNSHKMLTRAKHGYLMPRKLFDLHTTTDTPKISPLPSTYRQALKDPN